MFPDVSILYGGYWFEMFVDDYIYETKGVCKICVYSSGNDSDSRWVIGNSFMRGYYVTHDLEQMKVGIAPQDNRYKNKGYEGDLPYKMMRPFAWLLYLSIGVYFTVIGALAYLAHLKPSIKSK